MCITTRWMGSPDRWPGVPVRMAEVVESDVDELRPLQDRFEITIDVARFERCADPRGKYQTAALPALAGGQTLLELPRAMVPERPQHTFGHWDRAPTALGLGWCQPAGFWPARWRL